LRSGEENHRLPWEGRDKREGKAGPTGKMARGNQGGGGK